MTIKNGAPINEAFRYYRSMVTDCQIQDALDDLSAWEDVGHNCSNWFDGRTAPRDVEQHIAALEDWRDSVSRFNTVEELEEHMKENADFVYDVTRTYEEYNGCIFSPELPTLEKYLADTFREHDEQRTALYEIREGIREGRYPESLLDVLPDHIKCMA